MKIERPRLARARGVLGPARRAALESSCRAASAPGLALAAFAVACSAPVAQGSAETGAERPEPSELEPAAAREGAAHPGPAAAAAASAPEPSSPARILADERASEPSPARARGVIDVDVAKLENARGRLACRLYDSPAGFPLSPRGGRERVVKVTGEVTRCSFERVPPGTYAVTVVHDENANGELDTTFYGAPSEGYGVSNDRTRTFGAPRWDDCKFDFDGGALRLRVSLVY